MADADDLPTIPTRQENFHLFLLAGQSNMAGRGEVSEDDRTPVPRVLMLNKENQWVPAVDPLHYDRPKTIGTGLGKSFGIEITKSNPDVTIGLIPCAVGGSPISAWKPGEYHPSTGMHPWDDCIRRTRIAMESGTLKGILWHQGENDCHPELSEAYETAFIDLVQRFRKELNVSDVPFVIGQLGQFNKPRFPQNQHWQAVNSAHQSLPKKVPHTIFVSSEGLTDRDGIHFDSPSYREFGKRYAKAYFTLIQPDQ